MRGTKILLGLAMLGLIGALTSYPVGVKASPQIAAMGGMGLAPKVQTGALPAGQRAIDGAKKGLAESEKRAKEVDELTDEGQPSLAALPGKTYSAGELISAVHSNGAEKMTGAPVRADGIVLKISKVDTRTVVYVGAPTQTEKSPIFAFRFAGDRTFEIGKMASFEGKFLTRMKVEGLPNDVYLVEATGAGNSESPSAAAGDAEKEVKPFAGWRFVGSVESDGGATGVFVRDDQTVYAQAGDQLTDGISVVRLRSGEAVLREMGSVSVISPW